MAEEDTSEDTEDNPTGTPDDTPIDVAEAAPEEAPADTAEGAAAEASVDMLVSVEDPGEGAAPEAPEPAPATDASGARRRLGGPGRTAAVAVGAALAIAAVAVGAAWAIVAIADDDDRSAGHEQRFDADGAAGRDDGRREQFDRERRGRQERREQAHRERSERMERLEGLLREREQRSDRTEESERERQERLDDALRDGSARPGRRPTEGCRTILSLGEGDDALTVLVCNLPQAEMRQFENEFGPDEDLEGLEGFMLRPGPEGFAPFELFELFRRLQDYGFEGLERFEGLDGIPFRGRDGWPFGRGERPFGDGDGGFRNGGRGFWFDGRDGDGGNGPERFCFGENGEMNCFGNGDGEGIQGLDGLSEEEQRQLDEWMESLRRLGLGRLLEDFPLEDFPFEDFPLEDFLRDYLGAPAPVT